MKKLIIAVVVIVVLVGGYFIYQAYFANEPPYYPISSGEQAQPPSISVTETPSTEGKYAKWLGDWMPENVPENISDTQVPYLHVELDSSGFPSFEARFDDVKDLPKDFRIAEFQLVEIIDDASVKYKVVAENMPPDQSVELVVKLNTITDKLEFIAIQYQNGKKVDETKQSLIRKERWEELASKGLLPSDTSEVQIRSKVARVKADMRSMAMALEAYFVDAEHYPAWVPGNHPLSLNKAPATLEMPSFRLGMKAKSPEGREMVVPATLTTPIAYLTRYFEDPFQVSPTDPQPTFAYYGNRKGWILISPGPDGDYDINPSKDYRSDIPQPTLQLLLKAYDPTNGTVSSGDVFRVHQ